MRAAARRAALFLLLLAAARVAAADASAYLYTRPLEVPAAGPVAVSLDLSTLRHLGTGRFAVFAPDGSEVSARLEHDFDCCRVKADLVEARQEGESWRLVLDLGPSPPLHEQLHFRLLGTAAAAVVRLEGSDDRQAWRPLAAGNLFRLGSLVELERSALVYPPNRHRWLRLTWPAAAGKPELRRIDVVGAEGRTLAVGAERPACRREGVAAVCALPLPAPGQIGLRFHLRLAADARGGPGGRVGYRLSRPYIGRWQKLSEGTAPLTGSALAVPLPPESLPGEPLRLELYGDPAPPRLAGWALELDQPVVVFAARRAGRYTLAYGGGTMMELRAVGDSAGAVRVVPGPERRQTLPPLPAAATAPGAPLDVRAFAASWPVRAPRAEAGEVMWLELPPAVLAAAAVDLSDVRLAIGDRQLPFLRHDPATPALAAARRGLRPEPERGGKTSRVNVEVARQQRFSSLSLTAPPPFRRWVAVSQRHALLPLHEHEGERGFWDCSTPPPLLCRFDADIRSALPVDRVSVRFDDGDNPPLASVDVALWRRRHLLVFVWPAAGEVRLLAGARGDPAPTAPRYDLELLAPQLAARPWRAAAVDVGGGTRGEERGPAWLPLMIPAVLALAAVVLLVILARVIGKRP
ncbi:MAG TPA: DUF3999 family protein [Thermoanaerobaculia bacterium]